MTHPLQLADGALLVSLRELIQAIDRRAPRVEQIGEVGITLLAQTLRRQAAARLAELSPAGRAANTYDEDLAGATMTDDGAPPPRRTLLTRRQDSSTTFCTFGVAGPSAASS